MNTIWATNCRSYELYESRTVWVTDCISHKPYQSRHRHHKWTQYEPPAVGVTNYICHEVYMSHHKFSHTQYESRTIWVSNYASHHKIRHTNFKLPTTWVLSLYVHKIVKIYLSIHEQLQHELALNFEHSKNVTEFINAIYECVCIYTNVYIYIYISICAYMFFRHKKILKRWMSS